MQRTISYRVDPEVFAKFPGYIRGVVLAWNVSNQPASPRVSEMLRSEEAAVRERLSLDTVAVHPRISTWRDAFRAFGAKPSEYRSSVEALVRRVLRGDALPVISNLVDIGTAISLRYLIPIGSHGLDEFQGDLLELRVATGREHFSPFGSDEIEDIPVGEIIFVADETVLTRRWVWRQANHTLTLPETRVVEFNLDALPPANEDLEEACERLAHLVRVHCGGNSAVQILSESNPEIDLIFPVRANDPEN